MPSPPNDDDNGNNNREDDKDESSNRSHVRDDEGDDDEGNSNKNKGGKNRKTPFVKKLKKWFVWSIFPKPVDGNRLSHWKKYDKEFGVGGDGGGEGQDDDDAQPLLPIQENENLDAFFKEYLFKVEYRVLVEQKIDFQLKESSSSSESPTALYKLYYNFYPSFGYFACRGCGNKLYKATDKIRPTDNKDKSDQKKYIIFTKDVVTKTKKKKKESDDDDDGSSSSSSSDDDDEEAEKLPPYSGVILTKKSKQKNMFTVACKRCHCFMGTSYDDCLPKKVKDEDGNEVVIDGKEHHCIHGICVKYIF